MEGHHIRLNTSSKHKKTKIIYYERSPHKIEHHLNIRKQKAYIMNGHHIRLNTSSKHKKTKSIYYERPPHQIEYII